MSWTCGSRAGRIAFAAVICSVTTVAGAGQDPTSQPAPAAGASRPIARWVKELTSSDAAVRDAARNKLMDLRRKDLLELRRAVEQSRPLVPSQTMALRQIVEEVFLSGEDYKKDPSHGFLGILMDDATMALRDTTQQTDVRPSPGVVVADRIPGFCASRMLLDGDLILGTSDPPQVFNSAEDLRLAISSVDPGTVVHLQVLRHGQVVRVPLKLDCKPMEADNIPDAENFRRRRAEKFEDYWRQTFGPLLKETIG